MSIFSKIWKGVRRVAGPVIGGLIGGPAGAVLGTALQGSAARPTVPQSRAMVPVARRVIPGGGLIASGVAGAGIAGLAALQGQRSARALDPATGMPKRRRRRRGITYTELKNHRRVENFLQKNYKCKSGGTRRTFVRKRRT